MDSKDSSAELKNIPNKITQNEGDGKCIAFVFCCQARVFAKSGCCALGNRLIASRRVGAVNKLPIGENCLSM